MKKFLYGITALGMCAFSMTSCSDKDNDGPGFGDGSFDEGEGTMEVYTPEESKIFLEKTATEALNLLNPEDQREVIELCAYFVDTYGDLDLPENFDIEEDQYDSSINEYMSTSGKAIATADPSYITRAAVDYVYNIDFDNFKGVYEPENYEWVKVGDSDDVIFKFQNAAGQQCELKANGSSKTYETSFEWDDNDYYYNETSQFNFKVPTIVTLTLTAGGKELVNTKVESNINFAAHNFNITVNAKVANITAVANTTATDSKVTEDATTTVGGKTFITTKAVANGSHLADINFYNKNVADADDIKVTLSQMLNNGEAQVSVIDKVYVDGSIVYSSLLFDALGLYADTATEAELYVKLLKESISGKVRYNNTTTTQATVSWSYTVDTWYDYTEYYIEPELLFPDGTTYYFSNYFETGFSGVENLWNNLTKKYEAIWDAAF